MKIISKEFFLYSVCEMLTLYHSDFKQSFPHVGIVEYMETVLPVRPYTRLFRAMVRHNDLLFTSQPPVLSKIQTEVLEIFNTYKEESGIIQIW
jgi:hypothetical protein